MTIVPLPVATPSTGAASPPRSQVEKMSVSQGATVRQAMLTIEAGGLGTALLIDDQGRFAALLTDGDVRRALLNGIGLESPIGTLGTTDAVTAPVEMPPTQLRALFDERVRLIPLLDADRRVVDVATFDQRTHIPVSQPVLGERELVYVSECVLTGWVSSTGRFVTRFEKLFADFCGVPHAVATSNGTTALHLAMLGLDIGPGDEVIVPSLSFIASANAVKYVGATPVFVDSEPVTWNMDVAAVAAAVTPRTRAIMAVHLYGHPADVVALRAICDTHGLALIEDAAEAHGASVNGQRVGSFGDVSTFSFFGNKIVTTGEGGMLCCHRDDIARRVRMLRDHGMSPERRYWHPVLGYNYRMTNLQAALGVAQMERIEEILAAKKRIGREYSEALRGTRGLQLPTEVAPAESVFWLYSVLVDPRVSIVSRDELMAVLRAHRIDTRPLFPPIHLQPIYNTGQQLPVAEDASARGLSLPSHASLSSGDIERIAGIVRAAVEGTLGIARAA
jgi:perosamine synthetase